MSVPRRVESMFCPCPHSTIHHFIRVMHANVEVQACTEISNELEHYHRHNGLKFRLVRRAERFSRGAGLEHGVQAVQASMHHSVLLFFADVDITFSPGFLFRCRANAVEGRRVYYPVVYSVFRNRVRTLDNPCVPWKRLFQASMFLSLFHP